MDYLEKLLVLKILELKIKLTLFIKSHHHQNIILMTQSYAKEA